MPSGSELSWSVLAAVLYTPFFLLAWVVGKIGELRAGSASVVRKEVEVEVERLASAEARHREHADTHKRAALQHRTDGDVKSMREEFKHYKRAKASADTNARQHAAFMAQGMALEQNASNIEMAKVQRKTVRAIRKTGRAGGAASLVKDIDKAADMMEDIGSDSRDIEEALEEMNSSAAAGVPLDDEALFLELDEEFGPTHPGGDGGGDGEDRARAQSEEEERMLDRQLAELDNLHRLYPGVPGGDTTAQPLIPATDALAAADIIPVAAEGVAAM